MRLSEHAAQWQAGRDVVAAFLSVLKNITKEEPVQYTLGLLTKMIAGERLIGTIACPPRPDPHQHPGLLTSTERCCPVTATGHPQRACLFHGTADPYAPLLRLLQRPDWFTQEKACKLLTAVIETRPGKGASSSALASGEPSSSAAAATGADAAEPVIAAFVDWLSGQLRRPTDPARSTPAAVSALSRLLREQPVRQHFLRAGGVQQLAPLLRPPTSMQLQYEVGLCLWQLSFLKEAGQHMGGGPAATSAVRGLVEAARSAQKEKVVRVALAALKNLLRQEGSNLAADMVEVRGGVDSLFTVPQAAWLLACWVFMF